MKRPPRPAVTNLGDPADFLETPGGRFRLHDYDLEVGDRSVVVRHTGAVRSEADHVRTLVRKTNGVPYGVALWPGAIALAHEVATRNDLRGRTVLELGAGTGLPGFVAAALGAHVVLTDHDAVALALCQANGARNGLAGVEYRRADWTAWDDAGRYDWIFGADILYFDERHPDLRRIFAANLAPGGRLLIADPFRPPSVRFLDALAAEGWGVAVSRWDVGAAGALTVGIFEITPPRPADRQA